MSGPASPPGGFRWVEPGPEPAAGRGVGTVGGRGRRRGWWVAAVVIVVVALAVGGVVVWRFRHGGAQSAQAVIGTPKNMLVSFSLQHQPVPGWRLTPADIGLPAGSSVGVLIFSNGENAYFLADDCNVVDCGHPITGFFYGINVRTGARLFAPVAMRGAVNASECRSNGPSTVVCVASDANHQSQAWVIDVDRGAVSFTGPTQLPTAGIDAVGELHGVTRILDNVESDVFFRVGPDTGVHGVGAHAERTWFVPGTGVTGLEGYLKVNDLPSLTIATEGGGDGKPDRVFSVVDGKDLTPTPPAGASLDHATVYNGGFAYQFTQGANAGVLMYDNAGRLLSVQQPERIHLMNNVAMPTLLRGNTWQVYTAAGDLVLEIPATDVVATFKTIGTTLLAQKGNDVHHLEGYPWQQWDLLTGKPAGPDCRLDLEGYVGSDGHVVIIRNDAAQILAVDLTTCQTLWTLPKSSDVWKVGTGLIESDDYSRTLTSVHAPN
jgi:hypothetical protein